VNEFLQCLLFGDFESLDCYGKDQPVDHCGNVFAPLVFVFEVFVVFWNRRCSSEMLLNLSHYGCLLDYKVR